MTQLKLMSIIVMLFACAASNTINAQTTANETVLQSFAPSELDEMQASDIAWLNFVATESFIVSQNPEKAIGLENLAQRDHQVLTLGINPFRAGITPQNDNQYFRIGDSGKVVVFLSADRVQQLWERKKINQK